MASEPDAKRRGDPVALAIIFGTLAAIPLVGLVALGIIVSRFDLDFGRKHLDPIPVAASACPYVEPLRDQVARLNELWSRGLGVTVEWPQFRDELTLRLIAAQQEMHAAEPHVPARIAERFRVVEWDMAVGRAYIPNANGATDLLGAGDKFPLTDGLTALADASDLIGAACGPPLYYSSLF